MSQTRATNLAAQLCWVACGPGAPNTLDAFGCFLFFSVASLYVVEKGVRGKREYQRPFLN